MNHYIYEITNNINNKKYIGKRSCKCNIEDDKYMGSGIVLKKAKEKYGINNFSKRIVKICKNEKEAFEQEKYYISLVDAVHNSNYYNLASGGEGGFSQFASKTEDELLLWKKRMSIARKGRVITQEWKEKILKTKEERGIGKGENNGMYGRTGINSPVSKKVVMLSENGELLKRFECLREVNEFFNKEKYSSLVSRVCVNKYGSAYGYLWLFEEDYIELENINELKDWIIINSKRINENRKRVWDIMKLNNEKPVYKLNPNTYEIIKEYNSITNASKETKISEQGISRNCNYGCNTAGGYSWIFVEEYNKLNKDEIHKLYQYKYTPHPIDSYFKQKVVCSTTNQIFNSVKEAIEYFDLCKGAKIASVCKGNRKSCGKLSDGTPLQWMYYEDYIMQNQLLIHNENLGQAI